MPITVTDRDPIPAADTILTDDALSFIEKLHRRFASTRDDLLARRVADQATAGETGRIDFLPETAHVRSGDWQVAEAPAALTDRRVEMTGPATPAKMAINALNSGAKIWLADFEDASTPAWPNVIDAQLNLYRAARGELSFTNDAGKTYSLRTDGELAT